jgi:hypothetical protein
MGVSVAGHQPIRPWSHVIVCRLELHSLSSSVCPCPHHLQVVCWGQPHRRPGGSLRRRVRRICHADSVKSAIGI